MPYSNLPLRSWSSSSTKKNHRVDLPAKMGRHVVEHPSVIASRAHSTQYDMNNGKQRFAPYPPPNDRYPFSPRRTPSRTRFGPRRNRTASFGTGANAIEIPRPNGGDAGGSRRRASMRGMSETQDVTNLSMLGRNVVQRDDHSMKTSVPNAQTDNNANAVSTGTGVNKTYENHQPPYTTDSTTADLPPNSADLIAYLPPASKPTIDNTPNEFQHIQHLIRTQKVSYRACGWDCSIKTTYKYHCGHASFVRYQVCTQHHNGWTAMTIWEELCGMCKERAERHARYGFREWLSDGADKVGMITSDEERVAWEKRTPIALGGLKEVWEEEGKGARGG